MVAGAVRKKRPWCICRRWFLPDARVGARQHACGGEDCQRARHREADRAWHARERAYDRGRRWQAAVDAAKAGTPPARPRRPAPLAGVPWDVAQDAMTLQALVILAGVARVLAVYTQDKTRKQVPVPAGKFARVGRGDTGRRDGAGV